MCLAIASTMIETERLSKQYGVTYVVRDSDLRVEAGEIVGFLGPNGGIRADVTAARRRSPPP